MAIALLKLVLGGLAVLTLSGCDEASGPSPEQAPVDLTLAPGGLPARDCERQTVLSGDGACRARWWCSDGTLRELICVVMAEQTRCACLLDEEAEAGMPVDGDACQDGDAIGALASTACGWEAP